MTVPEILDTDERRCGCGHLPWDHYWRTCGCLKGACPCKAYEVPSFTARDASTKDPA